MTLVMRGNIPAHFQVVLDASLGSAKDIFVCFRHVTLLLSVFCVCGPVTLGLMACDRAALRFAVSA